MAEAPNFPPPPAYEEAVLHSVDPLTPQQQQQQQQQNPTLPNHQQVNYQQNTQDNESQKSLMTSSNTEYSSSPVMTSSNVGLPSSSPSTTSSYQRVPSISIPPVPTTVGVLNMTISGFEPGPPGRGMITQSSMDAPAIIIHSAISTPGDEEGSSFGRFSPVNEERLPEDKVTDENRDTEDASVTDDSTHAGTAKSDEQLASKDPHMAENQRDLSERALTNPNIDNSYDAACAKDIVQPPQALAQPHVGARRDIGRVNHQGMEGNKDVRISEVRVDVHDVLPSYDSLPSIGASSRDSNGHPQHRYQSYDSIEKKSLFRNIAKNSGISSSLDDHWSESSATDKLLTDSCPSSRERLYTDPKRRESMDAALTSSTKLPKSSNKRGLAPANLMPTSAKMSKSYNDLSSRLRVNCHHDNKCSCPGSNAKVNHHHLGSSGLHVHHNKSSSNINKIDHSRCHKHHLLPETRTFQGARGMRSVSADDVRMRSGTDEYVWKDGKVQLKNGGVTHSESVRYVWKDGHVEKITTDANNEDTQVEILETPDNKTCSKINPVFICIFLIAVIAVVIILPVYYTS